ILPFLLLCDCDITIPSEEAKDEECSDPIVQTPSQVENSDDERNNDDSHGMNVEGDEGPDAEDDDEELYEDVNMNMKGRDIQMTYVHTTQVLEDTHVILTPVNPDVMTTLEPLLLTATTLPSLSILQVQQAPAPSPTTDPSTFLQDLLNFGSLFGFNHHLKTLEANFSEFMQTNQFVEAVSSIPGIVDRYIDSRMNEVVKVAVQLQSDRLRDEAQAENEDFLNKMDENIQKIIKEKVKEQVKVEVFKILPKIKKTVNEQLEAEMESNKSIHRSDEQRNLYKALVDAYECNKIILDTYEGMVTLKRRRDDEDKDKEPFAGSDRGSKRKRAGKEPESTSAPKEKASKTSGKSTEGSKSHQKTASESTPVEKPMQTTQDLEEPSHQEFETGAADDQPIAEASQHPDSFLMNRLKVDTLTPELLDGPTYELMKGSCKSLVELEFFLEEPLPLIPNSRGHRVIPFDHFINNDLEYVRSGASSRKYTTSVTKKKAADYGHIKWIEDLFYGFTANRESARDVYSKRRIIAVTKLQIVDRHNYKHLDWIIVCRDDDKLYKFKEVDLKRLRIQDIKDMLLLLVQGKLTNLTIEERFAFNVSLRMFMIVIQRRAKDLQLSVESYQKKLNLTKLDTYKSDLKRNIGTLNDVQTALDDCLKGIQMKYLP
nr:hypothetical protein [Tanacetum cinerariifolium]